MQNFSHKYAIALCYRLATCFDLHSKQRSKRLFLFCVIYATNFTDNVDFDLSGIFELVFEFFGNLSCKEHRIRVVDLLGLDHNANFSTRLNRERLIDTVEGFCDFFEFLDTFDVSLD